MRRELLVACLGLLLVGSGAHAHPRQDHGQEPSGATSLPPLGPERSALPKAGSYELPPIQRVGDHRLLDADGRPAPLLDLGPDQAAVVSFVYTSCPKACPAVLSVLQRLDRVLTDRPDLDGRVRLVTVSFDPLRDTPERMAALRRSLSPRGDWRFLTAPNRASVAPVLADFGQDALELVDSAGASTGLFRHVLKSFLVDGSSQVRNIYSAGFLTPDLLLVDLETLLVPTSSSPDGSRSRR